MKVGLNRFRLAAADSKIGLFKAYVEQFLAPALKPDDIVVKDDSQFTNGPLVRALKSSPPFVLRDFTAFQLLGLRFSGSYNGL